MTIYAVITEAGSWTANDASTYETTTAGNFDSAYARCATLMDGASTFARGVTFTSLTSGYIRYFKKHNESPSIVTYQMHGLNSSGTNVIRVAADDDTVWIEYWTGSAWTAATTPATVTLTTNTAYDVQFTVNSASGSLRLYVNNVLVASSGTLNLAHIANIASVTLGGGYSVLDQFFSECVVADVPTIGWRVATLYITGAGTTNTFDSGTYADVDETTYSTADFISSGTTDQVFLGACNDYATGGATIKAVAVSALASKGASGLANINLAVRAGGANDFSADKALGVGVGAFQHIWETNPTTAVAWVAADIAGVEIGVRSRT